MAAKPIIAENIEIPVIGGKIRCILCGNYKGPEEMYSEKTCKACYDRKQSLNAGKPKPKGRPGDSEPPRQSRGLGWRDRPERPVPAIREGIYKQVSSDGNKTADTNNTPIAIDNRKPTSATGNAVSDTNSASIAIDNEKQASTNGNRVSDTTKALKDNENEKPESANGNGVSNHVTQRILDLESHVERMDELLALALRRIRSLEDKLSPIIEKEEAKRDSAGLLKLRDRLELILKARYMKHRIYGIYVSDLYGPKGNKGGALGISKMQAYRLRNACRQDDRFRVEKAENQGGKWLIKLNLKIK